MALWFPGPGHRIDGERSIALPKGSVSGVRSVGGQRADSSRCNVAYRPDHRTPPERVGGKNPPDRPKLPRWRLGDRDGEIPAVSEWCVARPEPQCSVPQASIGPLDSAAARRALGPYRQMTGAGLNRLMSAQSNAVARRVTQDHAGPFCTMKLRTARGVCDRGVCDNFRGSGQTGLLGRSQVGQLERKEEMNAYLQDAERFAKRRTSLKDWPV